MIYTDIHDVHGKAIRIQLSSADKGIRVTADRPMYVTVTSLRDDSYCVIPVSAYLAIATTAPSIYQTLRDQPARPVHRGLNTLIQRTGGLIEIKLSGTRSGILLTDAEFLSLADNPQYVVTAVQQSTGIRLVMCG